MAITTSYFAVANRLNGTKISVTRFHNPRIQNFVDERMPSFAPSAELLRNYKAGRTNWEEYQERYYTEQREHFRRDPEDFDGLLERGEDEELVLLCYERFEGHNTRCHRMLLFDILQKIAEREGYEVEFIKEDYPKRK